MDKDFQRYMDRGVLGGYAPERVVGFQMEDKITPIYRDTTYHETEDGVELHRRMIVGGRRYSGGRNLSWSYREPEIHHAVLQEQKAY